MIISIFAPMKPVLTRIFCFFMAMQVLFVSTGFAVIEHLCKVKGKETFLFSSPKKCCAKKFQTHQSTQKSITKRKACCQEHTTFYKVNTNAFQGKGVDLSAPAFTWISDSFTAPTQNVWATESVSFKVPHYYNTAPPLSGRSLVVFVQSFLI